MGAILPPIKYHRILYISRALPSLELRKVKAQLAEGTLNTITPGWLDEGDSQPLQQAANQNRNMDELLKKTESKIPVRILSHKYLPEVARPSLDLNPSSMLNKLWGAQYDPNDPSFDGLILHIHGGGFVTMSSSSHQTYTRRWANLVKKPLFSLDYRLAPKYPYPAALDDCWQVYNWLIDHSEEILGNHTILSNVHLFNVNNCRSEKQQNHCCRRFGRRQPSFGY